MGTSKELKEFYQRWMKDGWSEKQVTQIALLIMQGYEIDVDHSVAAAAAVWSKGDDFYVMRQGEETLHNPKTLIRN